MEVKSNNNPSSYLSVPSSPDNLLFYSAPTSPMGRRIGSGSYGYESDNNNDDDDDDYDDEEGDVFEFETSHKFADGWTTQSSPTFNYCHSPLVDDEDEQQQQIHKQVQRAYSFSTMAFADQLFSNGKVLPLKLPPRLQQQQQQQQGTNSIPASPKSPLRIPFARRSVWNDNFDPFMVALEKVSDETTRGRKSVHRRTRSHSPFRTSPIHDSDGSTRWTQDQLQQQVDDSANSKNEMVQEAKGTAYARWVRSQTMGHKRSSSLIGASSKSLTKAKTSLFGSKRTSHEKQVGFIAESKMQKVKSILLKYTSFRKESNPSIAAAATPMRKPSNYFKKLSFKFKGGNEKKKVCAATSATSAGESKIMALVEAQLLHILQLPDEEQQRIQKEMAMFLSIENGS